jgi:hypothetical protein
MPTRPMWRRRWEPSRNCRRRSWYVCFLGLLASHWHFWSFLVAIVADLHQAARRGPKEIVPTDLELKSTASTSAYLPTSSGTIPSTNPRCKTGLALAEANRQIRALGPPPSDPYGGLSAKQKGAKTRELLAALNKRLDLLGMKGYQSKAAAEKAFGEKWFTFAYPKDDNSRDDEE